MIVQCGAAGYDGDTAAHGVSGGSAGGSSDDLPYHSPGR